MKLFFLLLIVASVFSSCYSYRIFPKEYRNFSYTGEKKRVFVVNPELSREYRILKHSGIFNFTNDSSDKSVTHVRLYPIQSKFVCGEPIILSLVTLGQFPVLLPDSYQFRFDEVQGTDTIPERYDLNIVTRYWFWDMFVLKKNFSKKAGQTLLAEYYTNQNHLADSR